MFVESDGSQKVQAEKMRNNRYERQEEKTIKKKRRDAMQSCSEIFTLCI